MRIGTLSERNGVNSAQAVERLPNPWAAACFAAGVLTAARAIGCVAATARIIEARRERTYAVFVLDQPALSREDAAVFLAGAFAADLLADVSSPLTRERRFVAQVARESSDPDATREWIVSNATESIARDAAAVRALAHHIALNESASLDDLTPK